jgi:cytosine/uracil/thiamine/allantoin permease
MFKSDKMSILHTFAFALLFVIVFVCVHILFKNIHQVFLWTCKIGLTTYVCFCFWIVYQLHRLPEWEEKMMDSFQTLSNITSIFGTEL